MIATVDLTTALVQYGPLGIFCAWLMWREVKQQERLATKDEADRNLHIQQEARREQRHEETQSEIRKQRHSIDDLVRALAIEVLSRPGVAQRAVNEARALEEAVKSRSGS